MVSRAGLLLAGLMIIGLLTAALAPARSGDVFVGEDGTGKVLRIHPDGTPTGDQSIAAKGAPIDSPGGLDFGDDGYLYVSDYGLTGIVRVNPANGHKHIVVQKNSGNESWSDVEVGPDGYLYASDFSNPAIYRVNPTTGHRTVLATDDQLSCCTYGLAIGPTGAIYAADEGGLVVKVNRKTGAQTLVSDDPQLESLWGIGVSEKGKIYVVNRGTEDDILRIDPSQPHDSNATEITTGADLFDGPYDIAFTATGKLLTASINNDSIIRTNPKTGVESVAFSGDILNTPEGVAVQP